MVNTCPIFLLLFDNLRILNLSFQGSLGTTAGKLEPVDQLGDGINQTTDTDNHKGRITCSGRIKQGYDTRYQDQDRYHIETSRNGRPTTCHRKRGNLLHTSHNQDKAQQEHQYVGKEPRHRDQPKSE